MQCGNTWYYTCCHACKEFAIALRASAGCLYEPWFAVDLTIRYLICLKSPESGESDAGSHIMTMSFIPSN